MSSCTASLTVTTSTSPGWEVTSFVEPKDISECSFDRLVVTGGLVGVYDAAINVLKRDARAEAGRALDVAATSSITRFGVEQGLNRAARAIHDVGEPVRNRNPILTFAGVELGPAPVAWRAGDSEVWGLRDGAWASLFPEGMLTAAGAALYAAATEGGRFDEESAWAFQETVLDDLALWAHPPIGLTPEPQLQRVSLDGFDELIVTTDGARLTPQRAADFDNWIQHTIHVKPAGHPHPFAHGDLTAAHIRRA